MLFYVSLGTGLYCVVDNVYHIAAGVIIGSDNTKWHN